VQRPGNDVVRSLIHGSIALLLASNYFAFQVELFDDEYEENHPAPSATCSITHPALNWESFDKDNALQAFVFNAEICIQLVDLLPSVSTPLLHLTAPSHPIRDKSPPEILV
jgi:hypothetical protein